MRSHTLSAVLWCSLLLTTASCSPTPEPESGVEASVHDAIGSATMEEDGTLVLLLRAESPDGAIGDAQFVYPPDHPKYRDILDHIGGLEPGGSKPVPPWPGE